MKILESFKQKLVNYYNGFWRALIRFYERIAHKNVIVLPGIEGAKKKVAKITKKLDKKSKIKSKKGRL
jgi:hypothetical protein